MEDHGQIVLKGQWNLRMEHFQLQVEVALVVIEVDPHFTKGHITPAFQLPFQRRHLSLPRTFRTGRIEPHGGMDPGWPRDLKRQIPSPDGCFDIGGDLDEVR